MGAISAGLQQLMDVGWNARGLLTYLQWTNRAEAFLRQALGENAAIEFSRVARSEPQAWETARSKVMGMLEGIVAARVELEQESGSLATAAVARATVLISKRVFVVHGHDHGTKETVARYLEKLGLEAVILHEKANEGQTVIEKIEAHSDVGFAVVLLTPDDMGEPRREGAKAQPRARQNVVLELGYFLGKLKRSRVCALYVPGVEIPSDYQGVLYVELDEKGAWRTQLAQELSNARMPINVSGLLGQ